MPFPNKDTQFSGEVAVEAQKRSAEKRRQNTRKKKLFREILEKEFEKEVKINGNSRKKITRKEAATLRLMQILLDPGTNEKDFLKALEFARDTIGEKPIERVITAEVEQNVIDEVERAVLESGNI